MRTSSHNLEIERGRHKFKPREERLCKCGNIEDGEHVLIYCNYYLFLRHKYHINVNTLSILLDSIYSADYVVDILETRKHL